MKMADVCLILTKSQIPKPTTDFSIEMKSIYPELAACQIQQFTVLLREAVFRNTLTKPAKIVR